MGRPRGFSSSFRGVVYIILVPGMPSLLSSHSKCSLVPGQAGGNSASSTNCLAMVPRMTVYWASFHRGRFCHPPEQGHRGLEGASLLAREGTRVPGLCSRRQSVRQVQCIHVQKGRGFLHRVQVCLLYPLNPTPRMRLQCRLMQQEAGAPFCGWHLYCRPSLPHAFTLIGC